MLRDPGMFLPDILEACAKVRVLVAGMDLPAFSGDWRTRDAALHNLEVIGEAVKRLPDELKAMHPAVPWKRIAGFRKVLVHAYFTLNDSIIWDVATHEVESLAETASLMLKQLDSTKTSGPN